jgi:RHS repeat-associated protein
VVDSQNQTLSDDENEYQYDLEGNRIQRTRRSDGTFEVNTFDHRNRLTRVDFYNAGDVVGIADPQQSVSYVYDAYNRLIRRTVDAAGTNNDRDEFFAGFDGHQSTLEFEATGNSGATATDLTHRRLWGPFVDQLMASEQVDSLTTAGEVYWPISDHTGTIRDVGYLDNGTGGTGDFEIAEHRVYNSFGLLTDTFEVNHTTGALVEPTANGPSENVDLSIGFTGRYHDALTGYTHHQNRWFDPRLGKWISEDPLSFAAGDINVTRYVGNAPLTYTDPTGLFAIGGGNRDANNGGSLTRWERFVAWFGGRAGDTTERVLVGGGKVATGGEKKVSSTVLGG